MMQRIMLKQNAISATGQVIVSDSAAIGQVTVKTTTSADSTPPDDEVGKFQAQAKGIGSDILMFSWVCLPWPVC